MRGFVDGSCVTVPAWALNFRTTFLRLNKRAAQGLSYSPNLLKKYMQMIQYCIVGAAGYLVLQAAPNGLKPILNAH